MPKILTRLRIDEVSSVDRGAGKGVKIMLMKQDPITSKRKDMSKIGTMFSKLLGGGSNDSIIDKSLEGLAESVSSIVTEATDPAELSAALTKSFEQFGDHLKTTLTAGPAVQKKEDPIMDLTVLKKALGLADTATEADVSNAIAKSLSDNATQVKKLQTDLKIAKAEFSSAELSHYEKAFPVGDDEDDADGAKKAKKAFRLASHAERDAVMKAAEPALPAHIQKILDDNAAMAKRISDLEGSGDLTNLTKSATDAGLPESEAQTIQKARRGDKDAVEKLLGFIKTANAAAVAGGVFKEFGAKGTGTGGAVTAYDEILTKAAELRKLDPKLTEASAFAKAYQDPANAEIVRRERGENRPSAA